MGVASWKQLRAPWFEASCNGCDRTVWAEKRKYVKQWVKKHDKKHGRKS